MAQFHTQKVSVSNPSYPSLTVPWMEVDGEICDRWLWTARNWGQQSLCLMYQKRSAKIPVNLMWALKRVLKTEWLKIELKVIHVENAAVIFLSFYRFCKCDKNFFLFGEEMKVRRCQSQAVGRVLKNFPAPQFQKILCRMSCVRSGIVMQQQHCLVWHLRPLVLNSSLKFFLRMAW